MLAGSGKLPRHGRAQTWAGCSRNRPPRPPPLRRRYGVSRHLPREEREQRFVERIHTAVARGGRVLLPVVALGRAQELLLILEEYWERHPELHGVPIYQVGGG